MQLCQHVVGPERLFPLPVLFLAWARYFGTAVCRFWILALLVVALFLLSLVYFSVRQAVTCSLFPVGRPSVELWSGFVVALDELEGLHAVWSLGICFPLSVAILLVAEFDSMISSVLKACELQSSGVGA